MRETAPGTVVVSFYPSSQGDDLWPGTIQLADDIDDFPTQAAIDGDSDVVEGFVIQHPAWQ